MYRLFAPVVALLYGATGFAAERPNIVWVVGEDMGPELGCYGDANAITPNMDRLAAEGVRYTHCYTHAPVCAPSRSGLITGRYPTSIGTHHMRSTLLKPPPLFVDHLRKAGYVTCWPTKTNRGKTDFNFALKSDWVDRTDAWWNDPPKTPFFGFFNVLTSHESQIRAAPDAMAKNLAQLKSGERRDPLKLKPPAYHPDTPIVRRDLANYYDLVTAVDYTIGELFATLDKHKLRDNTIVILTGDHGRGLPRSKRWPTEQGTHVPLIVRWPGKLPAGTVRDELVCFLDFPATTLALAGIDVPKEFDGRAFLGDKAGPEPKYVVSCRDRMDEVYDRIRSLRDRRYRYTRNYHPELPYAQRIQYMEEMPTMQEWRRLAAEGNLNAIQMQFFASSKPPEELYDIAMDPDEVQNLAGVPAYSSKLKEMRSALDEWTTRTGDLGAVSERELIGRGLVADRLAEYEKRKVPEKK
ncbi:MAG: sulfatase [Gemmataceae bacterium]